MTFTKKLAAGVQNAWFWFNDADGFALGDDTTALSAGTIRGAQRFVGIQQMPTGIQEGEAVPIPGDDTTLGSILFESDAPVEFLINFGQADQNIDAKLQGTLVETMNNMSLGLVQPGAPNYPSIGLLVQSRSIKRENTAGQAAWSGFLYPNVQLQPLNREQFQGRTAASFRYKGVAQVSQYKPWGVTISESANGSTETVAFDINTPYPVTLDALKLNGVLTSYTLNKTPVNVAETLLFVERVPATVNSVTPSTRVMAIGAGVSGQRGVVIYGYQ